MNRLIAITLVAGLATATATANDFSNVRSGLLLGIYASPSSGGMRVTSTIPGYSAEGRLHRGDILTRATVDGVQMYHLRTHYEMENAKVAIGANRQAAVEIWRPGHGFLYAWVEFTPIFSPSAAYTVQGGQPQPRAQAQFRMESEKGGARQMFRRSAPVAPGHGTLKPPVRGSQSASSLFDR